MNFKKLVLISGFTITFLLLITPLFLFGNNFFETYTHSILNLKIISKYNFNPFIAYYDLMGPGISLPLGFNLLYFPTSLIINNYILYFFSTIFLCLCIQFYFLRRLLLFLNLNYQYLIFFIFTFSASSLHYIYNTDYLDFYIPYSFLFGIFFYALKFIKTRNDIYLSKVVIFLAYLFLVGHITYVLSCSLIIILFLILNNIFYLFKKKFFYFLIILFLFVVSEEVYRLFVELKDYGETTRNFRTGYNFQHIFSGFYGILQLIDYFIIDLNFITKFRHTHNLFLPFINVIFYFALFVSISQFIKKNSKEIFYLNYLFIFSFLIMLSKKNILFIDSPWYFRDVNFVVSLILFSYFLKGLNNSHLRNIIYFFSFFLSFMFFVMNFNLLSENNKFNLFNPNKNETSFSKFLKSYEPLKQNDLNKTYVSPEVYHKIRVSRGDESKNNIKIFDDTNIFDISDLDRYNLQIFTNKFKSNSMMQIRKHNIMYGHTEPRYTDIDDKFFFNIFRIRYLIIFERELKKINQENFEIIETFKSESEKIIFLKKKQEPYVTLKKNFKKDITSKKCHYQEQIYCLIDLGLFENFDNLELKRIGLNKYEIKNLTNDKLDFILPFLKDENWHADNQKIKYLQNSLMYVSIKPKKTVMIRHKNYTRTYLKILSIISFISLIVIIFLKKYKY